MTGGSQARVLACDPIVILACDLIVNLDWGTFAIWIMSHPQLGILNTIICFYVKYQQDGGIIPIRDLGAAK